MKVLVLGDGLLGSEIVKQTGWDYWSRKTGFDIFDIDPLKIREYDVMVNCIANTNTYSNDKESHWDVNYKFVDDLIFYGNGFYVKLVHISTDYIYANSESNATEDSIPAHGNNWYSYTKLLADGLIQLKSKDYLLCRTSFKPRPFPYENAWDDQLTNGDYVDVIASMIIEAINKGLSGVYNIGTEVKTMYELVSKDRDVIRTNSVHGAPKDVSMNIDKFKKDIK